MSAPATTRAAGRVAVFRAELLPVSQTFIRDQAGMLPTWNATLVGRREVEGGLQTPGVAREIVPVGRSRVLDALRFWLSLPQRALVRRLEALRVDLVHVHFATDAAEVWPSVKAAGLPMLVTLHGYDINTNPRWWRAGRGGLRWCIYPSLLLRMAREPRVRFVAVSRAIQRRAVAYGIPAEKVELAHIGLDTERFRPGGLPIEQRARRILFVGRMVEKKAPLLMVRTFAEVRKVVPDAQLVMIGDGPLLAAARRLAAELDVPVSFSGAQPSEAVRAHLHEARVLCLPSVTAGNGDAEGLPISLLEAQACGVPVVTSAMGGVEEGLLDGLTGCVCREGAMDELVAGIRTMLCDDVAAKRFSRAAAVFASDKFDIRNCSSTLERVYHQCSIRRPEHELASAVSSAHGT